MSLEQSVPLYYLATMVPTDNEDLNRIKRHIAEREGWGFDTIERGYDILQCLRDNQRTLSGQKISLSGIFLLDSVTALLSNEMFRPGGVIDLNAPERLAKELSIFATKTGNTVFVSDYIYSDARQFDQYQENYRMGLALIDSCLLYTSSHRQKNIRYKNLLPKAPYPPCQNIQSPDCKSEMISA